MMKRKIKEFSKAEVGAFGEKTCVKYLKQNGYKILDRNSKIGHLETDIIAYNKTHIVFAEVKTRRINMKNSSRPSSAVDKNKQNNLIIFAKAYIKYLPEKLKEKQLRIDVCEILVHQDKNKLKTSDLNYIEGAISR